VLVDDLQGSVHQVYSGLADPTYLIDADGRVSYFSMWTGASGVHEAIEVLLKQGGRGVVKGGWDRLPHMAPMFTDGWRGIRLGLAQSYIDLTIAAPGTSTLIWLGYQARPVLAPLTLRAEPLSGPVKAALVGGLGLAAALLALWVLR
jgi:hypothetical protein